MKALVVGYGRMGRFHAKVLADLGYEVTTVDPDPVVGADYATIADALPSPADFLRQPERFDVAAIACPPEHLLDAAYELAGTPMLVEKPFALNIRDARLLAAYLGAAGAPVCVGFVERFNPQVRALRALLRDQTLRNVEHVKFTRWSDRPSFDVALDLRLHDADLWNFLGLGSATVSFDARADQPEKVRTIEVTHDQGVTTFDLMDHALSPLHGLWHAFLTGGKVPGPSDAIYALEALPFTAADQAAYLKAA